MVAKQHDFNWGMLDMFNIFKYAGNCFIYKLLLYSQVVHNYKWPMSVD